MYNYTLSEELSRLAARKYARIIQKLGFPVRPVVLTGTQWFYCYLDSTQARFMEFKIQNMVGSCDVKFPIRLEGLVVKHSQFSRYIFLLHARSLLRAWCD